MAGPVRISIVSDADNSGFRAAVDGADNVSRSTDKLDTAMRKVSDRMRDAGTAARGAGSSVEDMGDDLKDAARDAATLDRQIDQLNGSIRTMAREFAQVGDRRLIGNIRKAETELRKLTSVRRHIDVEVDVDFDQGVRAGGRFAENMAAGMARAGGAVSAALSTVFGTLPPQAQAGIGAALITAVASAAPFAGAALSAGIIGGLSVAAIGGGIALAMRDAALKAEVEAFGSRLADRLTSAASSFQPAIRSALAYAEREFQGLMPRIRGLFEQSSTFLAPLTRGVMNFVRNALPGIETGLAKAKPVMDALESGFGYLGTAAGDFIAIIAEGADGAGVALHDLFVVAGAGLRHMAQMIAALSKAYGMLRLATAITPGDRAAIASQMAQGQIAAEQFEQSLGNLATGMRGTGASATAAAEEIYTLADAIRDQGNAAISSWDAVTRLEESIDNASQAVRDNGKTLDANTEKGRNNRNALSNLATATINATEQLRTQGATQAEVNRQNDRGYTKFVNLATSMGMSKTGADRLARSLGLVPSSTTAKVSTPGLSTSKAGAEALARELRGLDGKSTRSTHTHTIYTVQKNGNIRVSGPGGSGTLLKNALPPSFADRNAPTPAPTPGLFGAPTPTTAEPVAPSRRYAAASTATTTQTMVITPAPLTVVAGAGGSGGDRHYHLTVNVPPTVDKAEVGREVVRAIQALENGNTQKYLVSSVRP